jgi:arginyl-tRNA synthetase
VNLQSGDSTCRAIWNLLCDISRKEFSEIYKALDITIEEFGESFYNAMIPGAIQDLTARNLVAESEGMLVVKLDHFTIPLILRKSDGGYGYDSTDMAALQYRLYEKQCDWIIYITDLGQQPHFHMCFDAGRAAGWLTDIKEKTGRDVRLDHVGFGVVCGEDGKRFKTRSSETVRLIDLLNAAKDTMYESLKTRNEENNTSLSVEEMEEAAKCIGYGAIKYFDLKQHPATNYIFDYGRMLDTRGDTAVYLMFAYARLASILRKAKEDRNIDIDLFKAAANSLLVLEHPSGKLLPLFHLSSQA